MKSRFIQAGRIEILSKYHFLIDFSVIFLFNRKHQRSSQSMEYCMYIWMLLSFAVNLKDDSKPLTYDLVAKIVSDALKKDSPPKGTTPSLELNKNRLVYVMPPTLPFGHQRKEESKLYNAAN